MANSPSDDSASIRRYLLGDVSDAERGRVEEFLMVDDDFYDRILVEEDELVDAYLDDDLSPEDARRFDTVFLVAPERRAKLRFARTLRSFVAASAGGTRGAPPSAVGLRAARPARRWAFAAAAAAVLLTIGLGFTVRRTWQLEAELAAARGARDADTVRVEEAERRAEEAERERERIAASLQAEQRERERLAAELANRPAAAPRPAPVLDTGSAVAAITLEPGRVRGGGDSARLAVGRGTEILKLRLAGAPDVPGPVAVSVRDADGNVVWTGRAARSSGGLVLFVPADDLAPNDYQVVLEAGEVLARYYFRLSRR
jgi:hypothetical protein